MRQGIGWDDGDDTYIANGFLSLDLSSSDMVFCVSGFSNVFSPKNLRSRLDESEGQA